MIPFFPLWCLIKLVGRGEATHGYEKVGWVRAELSWCDGAAWFVLNFFFFSCGPGFRNVSVKKVSIYFAAFFFSSFLFFKYHPSIHNQISVSRVKTRI